ncbi:unnamed protein product [Larinioides sclopetarius]|uniref:Uncharacterized protein n=2 Tax=Larinioides sclopetarius TaxID=280406 RepID=A0AAV2BMK3_9ARAC
MLQERKNFLKKITHFGFKLPGLLWISLSHPGFLSRILPIPWFFRSGYTRFFFIHSMVNQTLSKFLLYHIQNLKL